MLVKVSGSLYPALSRSASMFVDTSLRLAGAGPDSTTPKARFLVLANVLGHSTPATSLISRKWNNWALDIRVILEVVRRRLPPYLIIVRRW
jgi:hypothetical protein